MEYLIIGLVIVQLLCLIFGIIQGIRHINTDPFFKAIPWLVSAMILWPIFLVLTAIMENQG